MVSGPRPTSKQHPPIGQIPTFKSIFLIKELPIRTAILSLEHCNAHYQPASSLPQSEEELDHLPPLLLQESHLFSMNLTGRFCLYFLLMLEVAQQSSNSEELQVLYSPSAWRRQSIKVSEIMITIYHTSLTWLWVSLELLSSGFSSQFWTWTFHQHHLSIPTEVSALSLQFQPQWLPLSALDFSLMEN